MSLTLFENDLGGAWLAAVQHGEGISRDALRLLPARRHAPLLGLLGCLAFCRCRLHAVGAPMHPLRKMGRGASWLRQVQAAWAAVAAAWPGCSRLLLT